ncbi:hypothetical protein M569_02546, partial [Genlisea aurea]
MEVFEVGPCEDGHELGVLIGKRFAAEIRSRIAKDLILQKQLLPFARSPDSRSLLSCLSETNIERYPAYWDELRGLAVGSGSPFLEIMLLNFRKEIIPFISKDNENTNDDCSDVLVVSDSMAFAAHNEDANVALLGHTYLIKAVLSNGTSFTAYTYAGELPSCAFGFNSHGMAFTLNSVPPLKHEIEAGAVGRNFVSRDLLEAQNIDDAVSRICSSRVSVGHGYNLIDTKTRRILNLETASRGRFSIFEVGDAPFFHANAYLHLKVDQEEDENSMRRHKRAITLLENGSSFVAILGDKNDAKHPIYMTGPLLYTLCTVAIDLDRKMMCIYHGNPLETQPSNVFLL